MSMMVSFLFPRDVLDEILDIIESGYGGLGGGGGRLPTLTSEKIRIDRLPR